MPLGKQKGGGASQPSNQQMKPKNLEVDSGLPNF